MNIQIICLGKLKEKYLIDGIAEYTKRIQKYATIRIIELPDEPVPENASEKEILQLQKCEAEKIKKQEGQTELSLRLTTTHDIAKTLGETKRDDQILVGFALETEHEKENALRKLERKHLDAIILNSLRDQGAGFGADTNIVTIMQSNGTVTSLPLQSKSVISEGILKALFS